MARNGVRVIWMPSLRKHLVETVGEFLVPVAKQDAERRRAFARVHVSYRACCVAHGALGFGRTSRHMHTSTIKFDEEESVRRCSRIVSPVKKSTRSMLRRSAPKNSSPAGDLRTSGYWKVALTETQNPATSGFIIAWLEVSMPCGPDDAQPSRRPHRQVSSEVFDKPRVAVGFVQATHDHSTVPRDVAATQSFEAPYREPRTGLDLSRVNGHTLNL
jgi:hypothetical protein